MGVRLKNNSYYGSYGLTRKRSQSVNETPCKETDLTVISNNCFSGFYYKHKNIKYNTPFIWNLIFTDHYINLLEHYDDIDYDNYEVIKCKEISQDHYFEKCDLDQYAIKVLDIVACYVHYKYDKNAKTPVKTKNDIYVNDNKKYCIDKWNKRSKRLDNKKCPIFIFFQRGSTTLEEFDKIVTTALNKKRKLVMITDNDLYKKYENDHIKVLVIENLYEPLADFTKKNFTIIDNVINELYIKDMHE